MGRFQSIVVVLIIGLKKETLLQKKDEEAMENHQRFLV